MKAKSGQLYLAISDTDVTCCWILVYPTFIRLTVQFKEHCRSTIDRNKRKKEKMDSVDVKREDP